MGKSEEKASEEELEKMKVMLRDDMVNGSQGFSTGLDYPPGRFADATEVEALVKVAGEYGGVYNTHVRGFDPDVPGKFNQVYGIREATDICRSTGLKTNISHVMPVFHYLPVRSQEMERASCRATIEELERGWLEEGLPIMYDVIANTSMGGSTLPYLISLMRAWVVMCGSVEEFIKKLEYKDFVDMIKDQVAAGKGGMLSSKLLDSRRMLRVSTCADDAYANKRVDEIMKELKCGCVVQAITTVLKADPYSGLEFEVCEEESIAMLLASERSMPCSDGFAFDLDTQLDMPYPLNRPPHPNNFCFAVRHLLNYGGARFEDKVRQMTGIPAEWFNLSDRGTLEEGKWADVVVIDLENLKTNEDAIEPGKAPDGIDYVIINGVIAADHKRHTGALAGKVLRRSADR